ncbi:MAG TPA: hypothetical protein VFK28_10130 [Sphingomicrobium sp.]|nr:hypothetical protein [Sphingomicrobium sp.]
MNTEAALVHDIKAWKARLGVCAAVLVVIGLWAATLKAPVMALNLVQTQDVPVLCVLGLSTVLVALWRPRWALPARLPSGRSMLLAGLLLAALVAWGCYALLGNFPLSRDEHMVLFDMAVYDQGRLATPIAPWWQPFALAMEPNFLLNANQPSGFVSAYLPMNPMLRLAFSKVADPAWFNPLLVVVGGAALLDIAKRTFGEDQRACWVVLLVYALSAQLLVTAMTPFSMTGHLALNLVWLAAFLRGGKTGHSIAIAAGFAATGLHQLVFHPFFVAPFLLWRLRQGQWRLVAGYAVAYAAIALWWAVFPLMVSPLVAGPLGRSTNANVITDKLIPLLFIHDPRTIPLMMLNLLRFTAWQNFALVPLLIAAVPVVLRKRGFAGALALGIFAWLLFLTAILPEQGRGYGYRYLHGYLGSFALLAGFGYRELEERIGRQADGVVVLMSGLTLIAALPLLFAASYRFMQPHLAMERLIESQKTPFVLIDDNGSKARDGGWAEGAGDHVRNLPDMSNRPLRFSAEVLPAELLSRLCGVGSVTLVTRADINKAGLGDLPERSPKFDALVRAAARDVPGCFRNAS